MKTVHRYPIPIDDQPHPLPTGRWVELDNLALAAEQRGELGRAVQVCATGQDVPDAWAWAGSFVDGGSR